MNSILCTVAPMIVTFIYNVIYFTGTLYFSFQYAKDFVLITQVRHGNCLLGQLEVLAK